MAIPEKTNELIGRFDRNIEAYKSGNYNETEVRHEFIDPFFISLGWDVNNENGYAEAYKDVIHEDSIKIGGTPKAPDYCFRIGGVRKFFLEAKKPSINIREDTHPAYQLRRYAWSAKLPLSILTDFEEFAVYDCRIKPVMTDKASKARIFYCTYKEYPQKWDEMISIFSQEEILKGSFDKYVESKKIKKGTNEVDRIFLKEIESWRELLARNIAIRNPALTRRELNFSVQRTIDRIIFLRICEDRGIEDYGTLMSLLNGTNVYHRMFQLFYRADEIYNSGLFHFRTEKDYSEPADEITPSLKIDDRTLKDIIKNLYYPESPYEFSVLPADILGQVYEQFLGKVIRLTPAHRAVVENKPEVKKAGGVYYTPTYIVDYIVEHTVGKLLEGKTPKQASKLRILDPACGSGSFLIGAYQYLLDWHLDWYEKNDPEKWAKSRKPRLHRGYRGGWRLTTDERKDILLNNIYGVDIDPQAVEVTKLSLLLKVLEGENEETLARQYRLFHERALPNLSSNIKCGNSLIGPDFYDSKQLDLFDEEERYRINVFDWDMEFAEIMKAGGFDAVIGNPPYIFGRDWKALNISEDIKKYLGNYYKSSPYQLDMFSIFMEKAYFLCKTDGYIGQIVPNVWLTNTYSSSTRAFIFEHSSDLCITDYISKVFKGITVDTIVYHYKKTIYYGKIFEIKSIKNGKIQGITTQNTKTYLNGQRPISTVIDPISSNLVFRIKNNNSGLQDFAIITRGVHPYRTGGYGKTAFGTGYQTLRDVNERPYHSINKKEGYISFIYGRDLKRYFPIIPNEFVKYGPWLAEPRRPEFFQGERIYSRKILGERLVITLEKNNSIADQQVYITKPKKNGFNAYYLTGLLGSLLMSFFIRKFYSEENEAFPQIKVGQLKSLPICKINFSDPLDKSRHDHMVELVENMLSLHKQLNKAKTAHDKEVLKRQIDATDKQIDNLVYELYGLTEEEIKIVEETL
ncbi:Eco57I restriction-modification methylase domain-containing protein [Candidatus Latescibacterota bacterium]